MILEQLHLEALGHASYLLGDERTGRALVLDPRRDVDVYLEVAHRRDLRITAVLDSHGHNDYLSGLSELTARTGAQALGSAAGELGYDHRPVADGEVIELGDVALEVLHTPGHTPEHVSLLVRDHAVGDEPALLLSGGALLVGDVARPDLVGSSEEVVAAARRLCRTLSERILSLPDFVQVWPTHVAGSLCGGSIGSRLSTSIGYERRTNPVLVAIAAAGADGDCIDLDDLPAVPPYWRRMRARNLAGVEPLGPLPEPPALEAGDFERAARSGQVVLDVRAPEAFGGGHVPGALNVGLDGSFPTWAGTVLPEEAAALLVLDDPGQLRTVMWHLLRIGYPAPAGWLAGGMRAWRAAAEPLVRLPQITVHELAERLGSDPSLNVLDVRQPAERSAGHIPGSVFVTGAELPERLDEVPPPPVAVICGSGYRSSVAASLVLAHGGDGGDTGHASGERRGQIVNVLGGMTAWEAAGFPTTS